MQLVGGDPNARAAGVSPLVTKVNYFLGNEPNEWHTNIPTFAKVHYDDVYPGIDLVYYGIPPSPSGDHTIPPSPLGRGDVGEGNTIPPSPSGRGDGGEGNTIPPSPSGRGDVGEGNTIPPSPSGRGDVGEGNTIPPSPSGRGDGGEGRGGFEYDFIVAPGADPNQIQLSFTGADSVTLDAAGNLNLQAGDTQLRQNAPYIYQEVNGNRQQVPGAFALSTQHSALSTQVSFDIGEYDVSRPLVIDPMVVSYSTYLGGPNYDSGFDIAVDKSGSAYLAGEASPGFPLVNPVQQFAGGRDVFAAKFSPDGSTLVYCTYIGGSYFDAADSIAVDFKGGAYITGATLSNDFPTTPGAFDRIIGNSGSCTGQNYCSDAFVVHLSADGGSLGYSTFLGGGKEDTGEGIAVDAAGNAYVMGKTNASDFPVLNAVQPTYGGNGGCSYPSYHYCFDAFITKLNPAGSALVYSTYLGGNQDEAYFFHETGDITIDAAGRAYVTGYTDSWDFPTTPGSIQPTKHPSGNDAYVTKLSPDGSAFVYSTYLGGSDPGDYGFGIAADAAGNAYVTGATWSSDFPTTQGAFQPAHNGKNDAFVSKLKPDGSAFVYSTFLGGAKYEEADAILADAAGNVYVTGWTYSLDFPIANAFQPKHAEGNGDAFVTKLKPGGNALVFSSYLGGSGPIDDGNDGGHGLGLDSIGNLYVGGTTGSTSFPTVKPFQVQNAGKTDAFVTMISRFFRRDR